MAQNVRVAAPRPRGGTTIVPCCGRRPSPSSPPPPLTLPPSLPPFPLSRALELEREGSPPRPRHSSPPRPSPRSFLFPPVSPADSTYSSTASYACLFPRALTNSDLRERRNGVTSRCLSVVADQSCRSARGSVARVRATIAATEKYNYRRRLTRRVTHIRIWARLYREGFFASTEPRGNITL